MLWVLHLFTIITYTTATEWPNSEEVVDNNGWTPISREQVFGGSNREFVPRNDYAESLNQNLNELADYGNIYNNEEDSLRLYKPPYAGYKRSWNSKRRFLKSISSEPDKGETSPAEIAVHSNNFEQRKAKLVSTNYYINDINNLATAKIIQESHKLNQATDKGDRTAANRYEVTETNEMELADEENNYIDAKNTGPGCSETRDVSEVVVHGGNDFTNKFLSILSKYNIRVNDALPNYEQSRSRKRNRPRHEYILIPVPVRFSSGYKLAADPLLALILSNYGYNAGGGAPYAPYERLAAYVHSNQYPGEHAARPGTDTGTASDTDASL